MSRTKVVHIITKLELGGAQEIVLKILGSLDRSLYAPVLITGEKGILSKEAESMPGLEFIEVPEMVREISPLKDLRAFISLRRILRDIVRGWDGPVIVHTHSSKAGILGRIAARMAGVPTIVHTIHGFGFNDQQGMFRRNLFIWLEKVSSRASTKLVAVAFDNINKGVGAGIFPASQAVVIRAGVDTKFFSETPGDMGIKRPEIGVPDDAPVAVMVSCLKAQKAPEDFVRVAAKVLESVPNAHFLQVGDGELRESVLAEARRLKIEDKYHLLGWRRDVRDIMHLSDVLVLTSLWEGLPMVLPQAMAAGKPIVCTAVDGSPEAVKDGVNGYLTNPHDVEHMASRVASLLNDKVLARRMGEAGRAMAGEFDEINMLRDLSALYEKLLKEAA